MLEIRSDICKYNTGAWSIIPALTDRVARRHIEVDVVFRIEIADFSFLF